MHALSLTTIFQIGIIYNKILFQVNKPGRSPSSSGSGGSGPGGGGSNSQKERNIWDESRSQDLIQKVLNKELSLTAAAVRLGIDYNTFFAHLTDNGKDQARVSLLTSSSSALEDLSSTGTRKRRTGEEDVDEDDIIEDEEEEPNNGMMPLEYEHDEEIDKIAPQEPEEEGTAEGEVGEMEEPYEGGEEESHHEGEEEMGVGAEDEGDQDTSRNMEAEEEEEEEALSYNINKTSPSEPPPPSISHELNGNAESPLAEKEPSEVPRLLEKVN